MNQKMLVGSLEICDLPDIGITDLQVRIDTGAKTSSLHVDNLKKIILQGKPWVKFDIHPDIHNVNEVIHCQSRLHDIRLIKSSNGMSQERYVIQTHIVMGGQTWPILMTLANRSDMSNLMLLGREAMQNRIIVDPSETFLLDSPR